MATTVLSHDANEAGSGESGWNTEGIPGIESRRNVVHEIPTFLFLNDRALPTFSVSL